jgi:type II secretory pathway pseudopilin PulG
MVVEALLIVLSILLALAVNQWQDARRERQLADQALASFRQEIAANRERLRELVPYHERIRDEMRRLDAEGAVTSYADLRKVRGFQGFRPAFLLETAWRTAIATGALTHIDYRTATALSTTYTLQERVDELNRATLPAMMAGGAFSDAQAAATLRQSAVYLSDVAGLEREVLSIYDEMLAGLDRRRPAR